MKKGLTILGGIVLVPFLILIASCVSRDVPVTETYYETEYRTESYIEVGEEQQVYLVPERMWHSTTYFLDLERGQQLLGTYYFGYKISTGKHSLSQVTLKLGSDPSFWAIAVIDLTGVGQLPPPPPRDPLQEKVVWEKEVMKFTTAPEFQEWFDNYNAIVTGSKCLLALKGCLIRSDQHTGRDIVVATTGVDEFAILLNTSTPNSIIKKVQLMWFDEVTKERQIPYQVEKQRTVMQTKKVPFWEVIFH
jgi:hypothetical protein